MEAGTAALMRIYTDERASANGGPLHTMIVQRARDAKLAGATVLRGVVGFGESGHVQRASILDLSGNLPLVIEIVDSEEKLRAFLPTLEGMTDIGLVTLERLEVLHYGKKPIG